MHGTLIRYTPQFENEDEILVDILFLTAAFATISGTLVVLVGTYGGLFEFGAERETQFVLLTCTLVWSMIIFKLLSNIPRSDGNVKFYELFRTVEKGSYIVVVAPVIYFFSDIVLAFTSLFAVYLILIFFLMILYYPRWAHVPDWTRFRFYLEYGVPMIPKELSGKILTHADRYLITIFLSPTAAGIYAVSYSLCALFRSITGVLNPTLYPSITSAWENDEIDEVGELYHGILRVYAIIGIPGLLGLTLIAEPLLLLISTEEIAVDGWRLVPLLGFGFLIYGYENPLAYVLTAAERTDQIAKITIATAILNIIANLMLLPVVGLLGAVVATVIAHILKTSYMFLWANRIVALSIPFSTILRAVISGGVMVVVLLHLPAVESALFHVTIYVVLGILTYFAALFALGEISRGDLQALSH